MTSIAIIGSGNMGSALTSVFANGDIAVHQVGRADAGPVGEEVVILAVPYESLDEIVSRHGEHLDGKILVDLTNPVDFDTFSDLKVASDTSAAAELQAALPGARVVKAFNTNFAGTLSSASVGSRGPATTVLVAGDDADAKRTVIDLVSATGLAALDAGPLARARELEAIGFLQIALANAERIGWSAGFALIA